MTTQANSLANKLQAQPSAHARAHTTSTYAPAVTGIGRNGVHQLDLLELPKDPATGSRYALTLIDLGSRAVAAAPLKDKTASAVLEAVKHIYAHNEDGIKQPKRVEIDGGGEFSALKNYLEGKKVTVRVARSGRHSQQRAVENLNKVLARKIITRQLDEELLTGADALHWESDLPRFIKEINDKWKRSDEELKALVKQSENAPYIDLQDPSFKPLEEGTLVRVALDHPQDLRGKRLPTGNTASGFRTGDIRWDPIARRVQALIIKPGQSTRYMIEGIANASYARWQLQLVSVDADGEPAEEYADGHEVVRGNPETFIPLKLHGRRGGRGKPIEYQVEWRGYKKPEDFTWERATELKKSTVGWQLIQKWLRSSKSHPTGAAASATASAATSAPE